MNRSEVLRKVRELKQNTRRKIMREALLMEDALLVSQSGLSGEELAELSSFARKYDRKTATVLDRASEETVKNERTWDRDGDKGSEGGG